VNIVIDDLSHPAVLALITEHLRDMYTNSPPESVHALGIEQLRAPDVTFWTAWDGALLLGCGALKEIDPAHGEIKSMRTPAALRRRGTARALLVHIIATARTRGYGRLSLETGSGDVHAPARKLYESLGFSYCGPFADYWDDPLSAFMTMELG
jgi:putative acetyltransferase